MAGREEGRETEEERKGGREGKRQRERGRERGKEVGTFQVPMDDAMFMKVDDPINNLTSVVTNHALCKRPKVVQHLIQTPSSHPLDEDVDVSLVLRGSQTTDNVRMRETTQHGHLLLQPL